MLADTNQRKPSEPRNLSKSLFELKTKGTLCDVKLLLQGSTMSAHACVLAACSSYFLQLFQLNQEIPWCAKNPLVIDLESIGGSKDLCVRCVSKVIDWMYLRELIIVKDHFEHFAVINNLFHVFDSMPVGKNFKKGTFSKTVKIESSAIKKPIEKSAIAHISGVADSVSGQVISSQLKDADISSHETSDFNCSSSNQLSFFSTDTTMGNDGESGKDGGNGINRSSLTTSVDCKDKLSLVDVSDAMEVTTNVVEVSTNSGGKIANETNTTKNCQFLCCNPEPDINYSQTRVRKRRKMLCKACSYSSVSIKKILAHLQCTDHLQSSCPICLRKITNINDFKEHLKDHSAVKPFICEICNKRDSYWEYHKMHMKMHCRNKPFHCDLCQRGFLSKRSLTDHFATHKGSYLCNRCDYYTSDWKMYSSHLLHHGENDSKGSSGSNINFKTDYKTCALKIRQFQCQVCQERFTQKKNLARHMKVKHFDATKFKCYMCEFVSTRIDLLSKHMKKKHNCTLLNEKKKRVLGKKHALSKIVKDNETSSDFVSVLIPLELLPDNSVANTLTPGISGEGSNDVVNTETGEDFPKNNISFSNSHVILRQNPDVELQIDSKLSQGTSKEVDKQSESLSLSSDSVNDNNSLNMQPGSSRTDSSKSQLNNLNSSDNINNRIQVNFMSSSHSFSMNLDSSENHFINSQVGNDSDVSMIKESRVIDNQEGIFEGNKYIWLNETTGELLIHDTFSNMQGQNTPCKAFQNISVTDNSTLDVCDQLKSSKVNSVSGECSNFDLKEDTDDLQFPQTPQANVVAIDECDNLFPWNQSDNTFYSTWVLNETTGELNMVSFFSIQSLKNPTELKLSENSKSPASIDDDDTALFLNEGTGDLSVIYFNANGPESSDMKMHPYDKPSHDKGETFSDISDDDSDFLNEEFMRASASFMSNEENEKFLNELTGEFDIANLNNCQPEIFNSQVAGSESYLNEETGEISWNTVDNNVNNDLFAKPDSLEYDLDDSLNCEDFESFFRDVNGFSSQFCLDNPAKNWQSTDEPSDALVLNECTGELVKKT